MKKCTKCKEEFPATPEFFYKDGRAKDCFQSWCKICSRAATKQWSQKNRVSVLDIKKRYRENNKESIAEYRKSYNENNPDARRMHRAKHKAKKAGVKIIEDVYPSQVLEKWGTDCHICDEPIDDNWEMEHVIPKSHPDCTHTLDNIKPAHKSCNAKKGSSLL